MKSYRLTRAAESDLFSIWAYIAARNEAAADNLESEILNACLRLASKPDLGHFRRDITQRNLRFFAVRSYCLIVYDPESNPLEIIRILHGARDAKSELTEQR